MRHGSRLHLSPRHQTVQAGTHRVSRGRPPRTPGVGPISIQDVIESDSGSEQRPRRRLTRAEAKEQTRAQLLKAAAGVFARKGFAGASVDEIAEEAGFSIGAIYSNFTSKEDLFLALLSTRRANAIERRMEALAAAVDEPAAASADTFDLLTPLFVRAADRNREFAPLQAEFWLYAVRHPEAMELIAERLGAQATELEPYIDGAMSQAGVIDDVSAADVTSVAVALFNGLVRQRRISPDSVPDDLFAQALRWVFAGLPRTEAAGDPGHGSTPEDTAS